MAFRLSRHLLFFLALCGSGTAFGQYLIENKGQWDTRALLKLPMHQGSIFFEEDGLRIHLMDPEGPAFAFQKHHHETSEETHPAAADKQLQKEHTYRMHWLNANPRAKLETEEKLIAYHNYLLGNDKSKWQSEVSLYMAARYKELYPGIDLRFYFNKEAHLKYDIEVAPGADYTQFKTEYEGADSLWLAEGILHIATSVGEVQELAPYAYQIIDGKQKEVSCTYIVEGKTVYFKLGSYNRGEKLVIDPELVFSSFISSSKEVYGFTATYGADGSIYGGGIAFSGSGSYPTTLGALIDTFSGGEMDIVISKLNADGSQLIYSTYIGGNMPEMPYSMIEGSDGSLFVFGNTGSPNFPISTNAAQDTFSGGTPFTYHAPDSYAQGVDFFILRLDNTGGNLVGSTYFGGTENDGIGSALIRASLFQNDQFRGEITLDSLNNCYITSATNSNDVNVSMNAAQPTKNAATDGLIAAFNPNLTTRLWATYFGGSGADGFTSLRTYRQEVIVCGSTISSGLQTSVNATNANQIGSMDGFLLKLSRLDGSFLGGSYTGTSSNDANLFVDVDDAGHIYTFGASFSTLPPSETNFFHQANSHLFLQQYSLDLSTIERTTSFGDSSSQPNLSPSAFEVDQCGNLLLSAWGRPNTLFTSQNALKKNKLSDEDNDFYFFILDASWEKVNYATYFGADKPSPTTNSYGEHIDGGTSRFSPDGTIYQGICASCDEPSNFPTTPGVYGEQQGAGRCNLAVVKFSTDAQEVNANISPLRDTVCQFTSVALLDSSFNADTYIIKNPDGSTTSVDSVGEVFITNLGLNKFYIKAIDTTCGGADSVEVDIYGIDFSQEAQFEVAYDSCIVSDTSLRVHFTSFYNSNYQGTWDFGDGTTSTAPSPAHTYATAGTYTVTLYVTTAACPGTLSQSKTITLHTIQPLTTNFTANQCVRTTANLSAGGRGYQQYIWLYADGSSDTGNSVSKDFVGQDGTQTVRCIAIDTLCNRSDTVAQTITLNFIDRPLTLPNVFTPNGDGINDVFGLLGDTDPNDYKTYSIQIFNRWGALVYSSDEVLNKWDGTEDKGVLPAGVYFYVVNYLSSCNLNERKQGFVHLIR